jgi:hypothetical protein
MSARERPRVEPADLAAAYRSVDAAEVRLLTDGDYRRRFVRGGRQSDAERRRSLGLDTQPPSAEPPQGATLAARLDAMGEAARAKLREALDDAEHRQAEREYLALDAEGRAALEEDNEEAFADAEMEEVQQFNETGTWDDPSGLEAA